MGLLDRLLGQPTAIATSHTQMAATPENYAPDADFWYGEVPWLSKAGMAVTHDLAMRVSTVYACVKVIAETIATLPLHVYERLPDGGKKKAPGHPLYDILHRQPNDWQTAVEYWEMLLGHVLLRGNAYSEIVAGRRGFADQLIPLNPDRMRVVRVPSTGRLTYHYTEANTGHVRVYVPDEIFHLRGLSSDGVTGLSVVSLMRDSVGLSFATESFGARFFAQSARPGGVLKHPQKLTDPAYERLQKDWARMHSGLENAHRVAILEEGMEWTALGLANDEAQFLETRRFQVEEICRWFRVPPHMVADLERSTNNNIEHQSLEFVMHTLRPWLVRLEQAITRDLVAAPQKYLVEFSVDGLLRGDIKSRYEAYTRAIQWGWLNANEVRAFENMNPREGGDMYLRPMNMTDGTQPIETVDPADGASGGKRRPGGQFDNAPLEDEAAPAKPGAPNKADAAARFFATRAADRLVRLERTAVVRVLEGTTERADVEREVGEFYAAHSGRLVQDMSLPAQFATTYCEAQRQAVLADGLEAFTRDDAALAEQFADVALSGDQRIVVLSVGRAR